MNHLLRFVTICLAIVLSVVVFDAQGQPRTGTRASTVRARKTQEAAPKLEPPPKLETFPPNAQLAAEPKQRLDKALKDYVEDQVSAYFTFREISEDKKANLSDEQRKWLQDALVVLKPRTIAVLNYDLGRARAHSDLRGAYIASLTLLSVAEKTSELVDNLAGAFPTLSDLIKKSFQQVSEPVWEVTNVTGEFMPSYREGPNYSNQIEVSPGKPGYRFLRVKAHLTNISKRSDPPYTPWALNAFRRITLEDGRDKMTKPSRLAGDAFVHALTLDYTQSFPSTFVTRENKILRNQGVGAVMDLFGGSFLGAGGDAAKVAKAALQNNGGSFVEQGTAFDIDVLFPVPQDVNSFRLMIIGSATVPIQIKSN